jgi:NTE family protein
VIGTSLRWLALLAAVPFAAACAHTRVACPLVARAVAQGIPAAELPLAPSCPAPVDYPFTNLVFEGGGVKGIAYGGALTVLESQGILPRIERVAGTSAGAITATLVALGYTPAEVRSLLYNLDFGRFEDGGGTGLLRLFRRFGWYKGDYYEGLMRCLVGAKTGNVHSTFADLHRLEMRGLHLFATDLDERQTTELSWETTPDLEVALAARMSGSFPLFFAAIVDGGDVVVDGGVQRNYPIDAFDPAHGLDEATLGFVLENTGAPPPDRPVRDLPGYAEALLESILAVQSVALSTDPPNLERTVVVDDLGISTLDFHLTARQKGGLVAKGEECTCSYLDAWQRRRQQGIRASATRLAPGERIPITGSGRCGMVLP